MAKLLDLKLNIHRLWLFLLQHLLGYGWCKRYCGKQKGKENEKREYRMQKRKNARGKRKSEKEKVKRRYDMELGWFFMHFASLSKLLFEKMFNCLFWLSLTLVCFDLLLYAISFAGSSFNFFYLPDTILR